MASKVLTIGLIGLLALGGASCGDDGGSGTGGGGQGGSGEGGEGFENCIPGVEYYCYSGPFGSDELGECKAGGRVCNATGDGYGPCEGEILPATESCLSPGDEDCDGLLNEEGEGCVCQPGIAEPCYTGPAGTADVGICESGVRVCASSGTEWSACGGEALPSREDCATAADENCLGPAPDGCAGDHVWSASFGDDALDEVHAVAEGPGGAIAIAGSFAGSIDFGTGALVAQGTDAFIAVFEGDGTVRWARRYGDAATQSARGVGFDSTGNVYVTGTFEGTLDFDGTVLNDAGAGDIFVAKLDASGDVVGAVRFGDASAQAAAALAIAPSGLGEIGIVGTHAGTVDYGLGPIGEAGGGDLLILRLDQALATAASSAFGDGLAQSGVSAHMDEAGVLAVLANASGSVDLGEGPLDPVAAADAIAAAFDDDENLVWSYRFGANALTPATIARGADGTAAVTAQASGTAILGAPVGSLGANGSQDALRIMLSPTGALIQAARYGSAITTLFGSFTGSTLHVGGSVFGTVDLGGGPMDSSNTDAFFGRFDTNGNHITSRAFTGSGAQRVQRALALSDGGTLLVGRFNGSVDLGGGTLTSQDDDIFMVRLTGP